MADFYVRAGDTLPPIQATLLDPTGAAVDLTGATVHFRMHLPGAAYKVDRVATLTSPSTGQLQYSWAAGDTDTAGSYLAHWHITFPGGATQTIPTQRDMAIEVEPEAP